MDLDELVRRDVRLRARGTTCVYASARLSAQLVLAEASPLRSRWPLERVGEATLQFAPDTAVFTHGSDVSGGSSSLSQGSRQRRGSWYNSKKQPQVKRDEL